jgi:hypothetical protein
MGVSTPSPQATIVTLMCDTGIKHLNTEAYKTG